MLLVQSLNTPLRFQGTTLAAIMAKLHKDVEGLVTSLYFPDDHVRSALAYEPQMNDLFIVSYPKCGNTWLQFIVYGILFPESSSIDMKDFPLRMPFLEMLGADAALNMRRPGAIKDHFPFHRQPYSNHAKYIYIARNPYDCCVSLYYIYKWLLPDGKHDFTFGSFLEMFLLGEVDGGDYFCHVRSWYKERGRHNVLFITYEDLKKNTGNCILRIAEFLGCEYAGRLKEDKALLGRIIEMTSISNVQAVFGKGLFPVQTYLNLPPEKFPEHMYRTWERQNYNPTKLSFFRKGVVGDWRNHFSSDQCNSMRNWIAKKSGGEELMLVWKDVDLP